MSQSLFVFSGEPSGDLHGGEILKELSRINPQLEIYGVGGPRMRAIEGFRCTQEMEEFQVMGITDVLCALPRLIRSFYKIKNQILDENPDGVLLIDYPGFNLRMAKVLRKGGYTGKLIQYVCPTIWAWKPKRKTTLLNTLDLLLTIYPFEVDLFKETTLPVHFVGNPLYDKICRAKEAPPSVIQNADKVVGIFPGSRRGEVLLNLPILLQAAQNLSEKHPELRFGLSVASPRLMSLILEVLKAFKLEIGKNLFLIPSDDGQGLMNQADLALATSGTVTLELALHGTPTVMVYLLSSFNYMLAKHLFRLRLPYYCIVNILLDREVFPELIQGEMTPESVAKKGDKLLFDGEKRAAAVAGCAEVRDLLKSNGAAGVAAKAITEVLND
jgi:lipid-A-disaccharide synthase